MRMSRDAVLMKTAELFADRSTCSRLHVGAVFSRDGRILVTGYNGAPAGLPHCNHDCDCRRMEYEGHWDGQVHHFPGCRIDEPCTTAEHAERNGIAFAARHGVALEGSELHVTHMPCLPCAMSIVNAGIIKVYYQKHYRLTDGVELLQAAGIEAKQFIQLGK